MTFYYPWYGNPTFNKDWLHWNHEVLEKDGKKYSPPDSIGANFYPLLGPYSSIDPVVIDKHMQWMQESRIGILCTSWWGARNSDGQLEGDLGYTDSLVKTLLNSAEKYGIKIAIHLEPYKGRSEITVKEDLRYLIDTYGNHPALYRDKDNGNRPLYFLYDSYHTPAEKWQSILDPASPNTIRGTDIDGIMIALYVDYKDQNLITMGKFDGFYTYFATDGFTQGSSTTNWRSLEMFAANNHKLFIPCVGPGYADTRIR